MLTMLAAIQGEAVVVAVITLVVFGLIFGLLWWAIDYFALPEPFNKVLKAILVLGAVIVCINALLSMIGKGFIVW